MAIVKEDKSTPKTIQDAFKREATDLATATGKVGVFGINMSTIASILIQECGRWAERYNSDFLITWKNIADICEGREPIPEDGLNQIYLFAIRRDGVDHTSFFMSRAMEGVNRFSPWLNLSKYRKILAVRLNVEPDGECFAELRDITNTLSKLHPDDETWTPEGAETT